MATRAEARAGRAKARLGARARRRRRLVLAGGRDVDGGASRDAVRLLAPFDPVVWDRRRFELLWGWAYRFEAYTPAEKRKRGYYALPLLWRDRVIGWGNISAIDGHVAGRNWLRRWPSAVRSRGTLASLAPSSNGCASSSPSSGVSPLTYNEVFQCLLSVE